MNAITVTNLTKKYKKTPAVNGISFTVEQGEFFAFLGENGAGKSTTINMISTILEKSGGEISVFGNMIGKDDDQVRADIGIVFQNSVLDKGNVIADGTPAMLKSAYAKSRLIWYVPQTAENDMLLEGFEYSYQADHYNLFFQGSITEFLYENRSRITDYEVIKGSMDDVFLNLTERSLS